MTPYEIPLSPAAQQFVITLAGIPYQVQVIWCAPASCWLLDLYALDGTPVLLCLPIVTGSDMLGQFKHLVIGGELRVQSDGDITAIPQYDALGVSGHLYFVVP